MDLIISIRLGEKVNYISVLLQIRGKEGGGHCCDLFLKKKGSIYTSTLEIQLRKKTLFLSESIIEQILLKRGGNVLSPTAAGGTLVRIKSSKLEMLIWYILHKQCELKKILYIFVSLDRVRVKCNPSVAPKEAVNAAKLNYSKRVGCLTKQLVSIER